MTYTSKRLQLADGSWNELIDSWRQQCDEIDFPYDEHAPDSIPVLESFAASSVARSQQSTTWTVGIYHEDEPIVAFILNRTRIPKHDGFVARVRQLTISPNLDFGFANDEAYRNAMVATLQQIYALTASQLPSRHIHMHLRSPTDVAFFSAFGTSLTGDDVFKSKKQAGAWLHLDKGPSNG